ncbi:uncharacterized protein HMPREF1541_07689 [Cyphellophora europaea CBS 101466]|uniref:Uncharacterized protein n=1 Tax=Cyphellophora europaea (strain CBS 101466) TaxID=1220924 RepID=W2RP14_CYPE1|nr:uncharacterized protein HMPREF1541_07689 [Cyphellophora europaea CBS 101466]ETN38065.1 hypothetical protein HMPREF1541_07689 [Cyphellophora europaea CBS 101466]
MGDYARSASDASCETGGGSALWSVELSGSSATSTSSQSHKPDYHRREIQVFEDGLTHLDSLDYLMSNSAAGSLDVASNDKTSPTADDARGRLCEQIKTLVRQVEVSQQASKGGALGSASALKGLELNDGYRSKGIRLLHQPLAARPLGCTKLLKRRQLELWRNYSQSIAPWLDVCGSKRHFQHSIPLLAKGADYLHYAVLAASSRHLELQDTGEQGSESAGLYADAVQLLLPEMHTLDTPAIAACILLCVTELMNNPPQSCQPSLEACAAIMEASDVNVRSSGIQQSLFWAFANLTIANGSMEARAPVVSMRQFYPTESLSTATSYVRAQTWGEGYAKYAVFLTSGIASVVANGSSNAKGHQGSTELLRWKVLFDLLEDWHHCRPEVMQALMSYPSILDDYRHPFPMVLYDCAAAVVGNLLYHAAAISLLQQKPHTVELPKNQKSLLWHARQICGIVAENHERGVWPYVLQPLWTAGKVISNGVEREKIVEMLGTSQRECAWSTEWYITDLKRHWGTN